MRNILNFIKFPAICLTLSILLILTTCKDDAVSSNELGSLAGVWTLTLTVDANTCGEPNGETSTDEGVILFQCGNTVQIMMIDGIWGIGTIKDKEMTFTSTVVETDSIGCKITYHTTGTVSGNSTLLEGKLTTTITTDAESCAGELSCTINNVVHLSLKAAYESSCLDRDDFGDPSESKYILPYPAGKSYKVTNSYCVPGGHIQQQAYDFAIPVGDTILASRAGIVRQVKESSPDDGQGTDHNHVMIEHEDGTVGFYAHLKQNGVIVSVGENVEAGQMIAFAGHSGTPDIVHLHFGVYDSYPPLEGNDRAVNFSNTDGELDCNGGLVIGTIYVANK